MSFQHRPIDSPEITAALRRIKANRVNEPGPSDADRIAWMDGVPPGFCFELEQPKSIFYPAINFEVSRTKAGWEVKQFWNNDSGMWRMATWREVVDHLAFPPIPDEGPSKHGSWEENYLRRPEEM